MAAEAYITAVIDGLFSVLTPLTDNEFSLLWNFKEEVENIRKTLSSISYQLDDAERKSIKEKDKQTEDWLRKLKQVAYEVRDTFDEWNFEDLRLQVKTLEASSSTLSQITNSFTLPFRSHQWKHPIIGDTIKNVQEKLEQISSEGKRLHLHESNADSRLICWHETQSSPSEKIIGREREQQEIVDNMINSSNSTKEVSENECWQLFKDRAFNGVSKPSRCFDIGKDIAKKCNGVPLAAKTLGGLLMYKTHEYEWCRIRDSEIWEICKREDSILPILRLSYYDLSYPLKRCFTFCAIFPKDTKIEKERLIQLWMAHDLIPKHSNQVVEDTGNIIWDELCLRSFFEEENFDSWAVEKTYKMHDLMHDLAKSLMKDECHTIDYQNSSTNFSQEIRHITIMVDEVKKLPLGFLKKNIGLQSLILLSDTDKIFSNEAFNVLNSHPSIRVFEGCQCLYMTYFGCLKHLRYLSLAGNKMITTLPSSVCELMNLQTLKLDNCSNLESLPKNTKDLANLRHLHLKGCEKLKYMPREMRKLKHLKTLSLFVISGKWNSQLDELKELDLRGYLGIKHLDASIESGISLSRKSRINQLDLYWRRKNVGEHEKIAEALEVSSACLTSLRMKGYNGVNIPKWVGESSASLTQLKLYDVVKVQHIFSMNNPASEIRMPVLFPLLEKLSIELMDNLTELVSPPIPSITTGAFPNLQKMVIRQCPKLGSLPPYLKSLKTVSIFGDCSNELLDSITSNQSGLTHLSIAYSNNRRVLYGTTSTSSALEDLHIAYMDNLRELVPPCIPISTIGAFLNLSKIKINRCPNLGALPPYLKSLEKVHISGDCSDELLYSLSKLSGLTSLSLFEMDERRVLLPTVSNYEALMFNYEEENNEAQAGGPLTFQSLEYLEIRSCFKLRYLFDEEGKELATASRERTRALTNLTFLYIHDCPELMISVEQWRNHSYSLENLWLSKCPKVVPIPVESLLKLCLFKRSKLVPFNLEETDEIMALLYSLRTRLGPDNFIVHLPQL